MQTLLLVIIAALLLCAIGCLGYLIYLGRSIRNMVSRHHFDFDMFRMSLWDVMMGEHKPKCANHNARKSNK